jgi:multicomponent Na+:H+ antiporter subunit G
MDQASLGMIVDFVSALFIVVGTLFYIAGTVGLLRLPDVYTRLHALTKADNLGLGLIVIGLLPQAPGLLYGAKMLLLWVLVLVSGATGAHLIAKRAVRGDGEDMFDHDAERLPDGDDRDRPTAA